jgi:hypothetical protein
MKTELYKQLIEKQKDLIFTYSDALKEQDLYVCINLTDNLRSEISTLEKQIVEQSSTFQKLKEKGLISGGSSMDEINKQIEQPEKTAEEILRKNESLFEENPFTEMYIKTKEAILKCMEEYRQVSPYEGRTVLRHDSPLNVPEKPVFISDEEIEKFATNMTQDPIRWNYLVDGAKWYRDQSQASLRDKLVKFQIWCEDSGQMLPVDLKFCNKVVDNYLKQLK